MKTLCSTCGSLMQFPCIAANDNEPLARMVVVMACNEALSSPVYYRRLAIATGARIRSRDCSRRKFPDLQASVIFRYINDGGVIYNSDGTLASFSDTAIDESYGSGEDGSDFRWLSDFIIRGVNAKQRPASCILQRLRYIDLYFRLQHPAIARHFPR